MMRSSTKARGLMVVVAGWMSVGRRNFESELSLVLNSDAALYPLTGTGLATDFHTRIHTLPYPFPVPTRVSIPVSITLNIHSPFLP